MGAVLGRAEAEGSKGSHGMKPREEEKVYRRPFHPCRCTSYNGGQCFNCLNGAHGLCQRCGKRSVRNVGLIIQAKASQS